MLFGHDTEGHNTTHHHHLQVRRQVRVQSRGELYCRQQRKHPDNLETSIITLLPKTKTATALYTVHTIMHHKYKMFICTYI